MIRNFYILVLFSGLVFGYESLSVKRHADSENLNSIPQLPSSTKRVEVRGDGMEQGLLKQIEKMNFRTQMEVFYTAYSKVRLFYFACVWCSHFAVPGSEI